MNPWYGSRGQVTLTRNELRFEGYRSGIYLLHMR